MPPPGQIGAAALLSRMPLQARDATLERQQQILEAFSEAFVGLRKGYEQFGVEVGVRTINGRDDAPPRAHRQGRCSTISSSPDAPVATVKRDLIGIFADFGIHHIAMMAAVTEGVRALLQSLDPRANDLDVGGRLFSSSRSKAQVEHLPGDDSIRS